ncbi:MAG TPA: sigma-70 family RNA polymerase sigma factor [Pirellulaceae bacterium]|nr:sigma-70 family RNA polymerase sigma factor [Pirellulaceae bacterium]
MSREEVNSLSSADLLRRLHAGDEAAAEAVFERYADRLTRLAQSRLTVRLASRIDPEDIVQSAYRSFFVAARAGRFRVRSGGDLWRLLVEVTLHKLYRQAAHHGAQRRSVAREVRIDDSASSAGVPTGGEPTPDEALAAAEELEAIFAQLSDRVRQALELRLQGYEHEEIAERLACSERTVRRSLAEARRVMAARAGGGFVPSAARRRAVPTPSPAIPAAPIEIASPIPWSDLVLQQQIGAGATGKVYRALRRSTGAEVAVKFLRKSLLREPAVIERFLREAKTVAQIAQPGIVGMHGAGRTPSGGYFLVMDLIGGGDLDRLRRCQPVSPPDAAAWVAQAARIVHSAHEQGVVHCDLKPGNLLLDEQGQIHVTDFGLAARAAAGESNLLAGTPAFMAPEQVDPAWGPISPRTDIFGLGAVLFFLLFGQPPHTGATIAEVLSRVAADSPVAIPDQRDDRLNLDLVAIIRRCLAKSPAGRFPTAAELAAGLRTCGVA